MSGGGFDAESGPEDIDSLIADAVQLVQVESKLYTGEAISMHDMPHQFVIDIIATPAPLSALKTMGLFKLAIGGDADRLESASFIELYEAMNAWVDASNEAHRKKLEENGEDAESDTGWYGSSFEFGG